MAKVQDHWSSEAYTAYASFVPALTQKVLHLLNPQRTDIILDIGCGDGSLTGIIASECTSGHVTGLDSSPSFIATATETIKSKHTNTDFIVADCRRVDSTACETESLEILRALQDEKYDKVFSNAALHWILRDENNRRDFFKDVRDLLKPGGSFVCEFGGFGNVVEMRTAFVAVLWGRYGVELERIRNAGGRGSGPGDPWFFPSTDWMREVLMSAGFEIDVLESEYRPTKVGEGIEADEGFKGYVRLMGARFLDLLGLEGEEVREKALEDVCEVLRDATTRVEDGSRWLGFVRLRVLARKPVTRNRTLSVPLAKK